MLPYQMIAGGTFATVGTPPAQVVVSCNSQNPPDFIITKSITGYGLANTAQSIEWWWENSMAQYTAKGIQQSSDATNPALTSKSLSTLGSVLMISTILQPSHRLRRLPSTRQLLLYRCQTPERFQWEIPFF